jgi:hypothetical protein
MEGIRSKQPYGGGQSDPTQKIKETIQKKTTTTGGQEAEKPAVESSSGSVDQMVDQSSVAEAAVEGQHVQ